jgi:MoaA/NifB/PqqE/SkfB family radical SAM enzyme
LKDSLKSWQRSFIRGNVSQYRQALEKYYIKDKPMVEVAGGYKAFSLLSPPIASPVGRRRLRYIIDNLMEQQGSKRKAGLIPLKSRTPHFITIAVTYDCQCDCSHCSASTYKENTLKRSDALSFSEIKKSIQDFVRLGATSIVLTGGEPLLYNRIFDLVSAVDPGKAICTVFTNGEYLNPETVESLKASGAFGVFVSFDFADAKKHETNRRRPGIFDKAAAGVKLCQDAGILTGISTYVTKEKIKSGEMDALMELGRKLKVLEVFIFDVIPTGRLDNAHECLLNDPDFDCLRSFREKYNQRPDYPRIIHQTMLTSIAFPCTGEGCPAGVAHMHLRANGDVSPCDFTPYSFGNVRASSLSDIWGKMTSSDWYASPSPKCRLSDVRFLETVKNKSQGS